jgi:hypothetical protein
MRPQQNGAGENRQLTLMPMMQRSVIIWSLPIT